MLIQLAVFILILAVFGAAIFGVVRLARRNR